MAVELALDVLRPTALAAVVGVLVVAQRRRPDLRLPGWRFILAGFGLLLAGSLAELVNEFRTGGFRDVGGEPLLWVALERLVARGLGATLLVIGFFQWMPRLVSARRLQAMLDESERRRRALADTEDRLRTVADSTPFPIVIVRADDGEILYVNPRFGPAFGASRDPHIEFDLLAVFGDEGDRARVRRAIAVGDQLDGWETCVQRADGSEFRALVSVRHVMLDGAAAVYFAFYDLTDRRRMEQERDRLEMQLQKAQKLESLGVLAGGIAHDFNNLLMAILGNVALAKKDIPADSLVIDALDEIHNAAEMAARLSRQMLVYAGKGSMTLDAVDLSELVTEMRQLLHASAAKKVDMRFELASDLPPVVGDGTHLRQVVLNLVTNGGEAIGADSGRVRVRTRARAVDRDDLARSALHDDPPVGRYVELEVTDSGRGMDSATLARVFDPFFSTKFAGRGMGLAAVFGIVRAHRGAIWAESELGRGTTFTVLFPCKHHGSAPGVDVSRTTSDRRDAGMVLLVDDEPTVRRVMARVLERAGFRVITAGDGRAGVELFRRHAGEIGVVILDMTMPEMNGEEAFRAIREIRADARVILSSGYAQETIEAGFGEWGLGGFLQKPSEPDQLVATVRAVLEA